MNCYISKEERAHVDKFIKYCKERKSQYEIPPWYLNYTYILIFSGGVLRITIRCVIRQTHNGIQKNPMSLWPNS